MAVALGLIAWRDGVAGLRVMMGEIVRKVKHSSVKIENPLSALYRGTEYFSLARTFRTAWGRWLWAWD